MDNPPPAPMHFYPDRKIYHDNYSHDTHAGDHAHFQHGCPRKMPYMINIPTAEPRLYSHHYNREMLDRLHMFSKEAAAGSDLNNQAVDSSQKRVLRLISNRIAARECRQRKKDYLKHLERRAHDLERHNQMLMEEIRSLRGATVHADE